MLENENKYLENIQKNIQKSFGLTIKDIDINQLPLENRREHYFNLVMQGLDAFGEELDKNYKESIEYYTTHGYNEIWSIEHGCFVEDPYRFDGVEETFTEGINVINSLIEAEQCNDLEDIEENISKALEDVPEDERYPSYDPKLEWGKSFYSVNYRNDLSKYINTQILSSEQNLEVLKKLLTIYHQNNYFPILEIDDTKKSQKYDDRKTIIFIDNINNLEAKQWQELCMFVLNKKSREINDLLEYIEPNKFFDIEENYEKNAKFYFDLVKEGYKYGLSIEKIDPKYFSKDNKYEQYFQVCQNYIQHEPYFIRFLKPEYLAKDIKDVFEKYYQLLNQAISNQEKKQEIYGVKIQDININYLPQNQKNIIYNDLCKKIINNIYNIYNNKEIEPKYKYSNSVDLTQSIFEIDKNFNQIDKKYINSKDYENLTNFKNQLINKLKQKFNANLDEPKLNTKEPGCN